jgi:DNA-binding SARP family transcriptional activator/transcriptional regulator with XRE-family HTH domain
VVHKPDPIRATQIGEEIRAYRRTAGLSQRGLAAAAGLSIGAVRDLEQGRTLWPRWGSVEGLAEALQLDAQQHDQLMLAWTADTGRFRPPRGRQDGPAGLRATATIGILGTVAVTVAGEPVDLGSARQRAVLGLLALCADRGARLAELTELFWPSRLPATANTIVQGHISQLRQVLRPPRSISGHHYSITYCGEMYRLQAGTGCRLDITDLFKLARSGHNAVAQGNHAGAAEMYEQALALWRGNTLDDVEVLQEHPLVTELNIQRSELAICYADTAAHTGAHRQVLPHLRELCAREPLNERAVTRLMTALTATGQRATAVIEFAQLRNRLHRELGIYPGPEVVRVYSKLTNNHL